MYMFKKCKRRTSKILILSLCAFFGLPSMVVASDLHAEQLAIWGTAASFTQANMFSSRGRSLKKFARNMATTALFTGLYKSDQISASTAVAGFLGLGVLYSHYDGIINLFSVKDKTVGMIKTFVRNHPIVTAALVGGCAFGGHCYIKKMGPIEMLKMYDSKDFNVIALSLCNISLMYHDRELWFRLFMADANRQAPLNLQDPVAGEKQLSDSVIKEHFIAAVSRTELPENHPAKIMQGSVSVLLQKVLKIHGICFEIDTSKANEKTLKEAIDNLQKELQCCVCWKTLLKTLVEPEKSLFLCKQCSVSTCSNCIPQLTEKICPACRDKPKDSGDFFAIFNSNISPAVLEVVKKYAGLAKSGKEFPCDAALIAEVRAEKAQLLLDQAAGPAEGLKSPGSQSDGEDGADDPVSNV